MAGIVSVLVVVAVIAVALILVAGVVTMMRGGEFNRKYGNRLMRARLVAQAVAVVLVLVAFFLGAR